MKYPESILRVLRTIDELAENSGRRHLRALKYSVLGNGETPPVAHSPQKINKETGLRLDTLAQAGILLTKNRAIEVLPELGIPVKPSAFKRKTTETRCKVRFGKEKRKVGNELVFTMLELMILEEQVEIFPLPSSVDQIPDFIEKYQDS